MVQLTTTTLYGSAEGLRHVTKWIPSVALFVFDSVVLIIVGSVTAVADFAEIAIDPRTTEATTMSWDKRILANVRIMPEQSSDLARENLYISLFVGG